MKMDMKRRRRAGLLSCALLWAACGNDVSLPDEIGPHTPFGMSSDNASIMDAALGDAARVVAVEQTPDAGVPEPACRAIEAQQQPMRVNPFGASQALMSADDLFAHAFTENCGRCHIEGKGNGSLFIPSKVELAKNLQNAIDRIKSDDTAQLMPPGPTLFSARKAPDPVLDLLALLQAWQASGTADFFPDPRGGSADAVGGLAANPLLAKSFTNMGSCVPAARIVGSEASAMDALDAKFAAAAGLSDLPSKLSDTDLFTLDSEALARHGVISYAPAYTLWADDAKKMRYVRVPRGKSIVFSSSKQNFDIPDNTRFYKTFLKEVLDADGNVGFKKIETRVIVVRHNVEVEGEPPQVKALFGTYAWNEQETEAVLEAKPLRDGSPFADDLIWYLTDEQGAKSFLDDPDPNASIHLLNIPDGASDGVKLEIAKPFLLEKKLARSYGIPGSERCVECHRGGPDGGFVLGFSPLQIRRRPVGEGGVIDPATPDELNQLERLISYGLITGLSVDQIDRKLLKLEDSAGARSPRNDAELRAQGYMLGNCAHCHNPKGFASLSAPELVDLLNFYPNAAGGGIFQFPLERYSPRIQRKDLTGAQVVNMPYITPSIFDTPRGLQPFASADADDYNNKLTNAGPWRSLIFRNTDTPFTYSTDDLVVYPHMPLNTPGFDPRAPRIMAEWMLTIPAVPKDQSVRPDVDPADQPMREVKPGDPGYTNAVAAGQTRLRSYLDGRGKYTPNTSDIVDPEVRPPDILVPPSIRLGIPDRPHFVPLDLTQDPPPWVPRNPNWSAALVDEVPSSDPDPVKQADQAILVPILKTIHADAAIKQFASTPIPLGLWKKKTDCDFSSQKTVSQLQSMNKQWINDAAKVDPSAPVYMPTRGEAVFGMICINCHGANADSRGRQSDSLLLLTGGATRVANFRAGLFGPLEMPGAAILGEFGKAATVDTSAKDWASRYMAWMALGGTTRIIPNTILNVVGNAAVAGAAVNRGAAVSANMLSVARAACSALMPEDVTFGQEFDGQYNFARTNLHKEKVYQELNVIYTNGDADLWRDICTFQNDAPVRAFVYEEETAGGQVNIQVRQLYPRSAYPAGVAVMDQLGNPRPEGLTADNLGPWCLLGPADSTVSVDKMNARIDEFHLARCPTALTAASALTEDDKRKWSMRGAVNAGRVVFEYLDDLTNNRVKPQLSYSECEKLKAKH